MVRKLEKRFKKLLTMHVVVGSVVMAGVCAIYVDKIRLSVHF